MNASHETPATLFDRRTGEPIKPGTELEGHYGGREWRFERLHTFPTRDAAGFVGGMISVRNIASGHKATISVASFPHLYWGVDKTEPTNTDNAAEMIANLTDDDYVTTEEAAAVIDYCAEWVRDTFGDPGDEDQTLEESRLTTEVLLRGCHRQIEGGLRFILDDVRRLAQSADTLDRKADAIAETYPRTAAAMRRQSERLRKDPGTYASVAARRVDDKIRDSAVQLPLPTDDAPSYLGISSLTDAQAMTVDKLAEAIEGEAWTAVHSEILPDVHADESGTVLVILTADSPAEDPAVRVWTHDGRQCYPVRGRISFESAHAYIRGDGKLPIVQRESSEVFSIAPGGTYERRRFT